MPEMQIVEVRGYQWRCSDCQRTGFIESEHEHAQDASFSHRCAG